MGVNKYDIEVFCKNEERFITVLRKLVQILEETQNTAQAEFLCRTIDLIKNQQLEEFFKSINGIGMWGGSGAVWEVYIAEESVAREFEKQMLILIELMEGTGIMGRGIAPIKRIFEKNLNP